MKKAIRDKSVTGLGNRKAGKAGGGGGQRGRSFGWGCKGRITVWGAFSLRPEPMRVVRSHRCLERRVWSSWKEVQTGDVILGQLGQQMILKPQAWMSPAREGVHPGERGGPEQTSGPPTGRDQEEPAMETEKNSQQGRRSRSEEAAREGSAAGKAERAAHQQCCWDVSQRETRDRPVAQ